VGGQRVLGHQLYGDLPGKFGIEPAIDVDRRQFLVLVVDIRRELPALAIEVRLFGIRLGADRHILARGHGHGAGNQTGDSGHQYCAVGRVRGGHAHHQARRRHDAVIRAQHGGAQPAYVLSTVPLTMENWHFHASP
jgi:hypothetical protein